ncbi:MAG: sensor histidine kinase, partial [Thermomicrobiaceae bacterium]|nr:sensor histidine kinase [Thermomicrobiaceae bacterium]
VLRNLLLNAIKYTPDGTPIEVTARRAGPEVEIGVRDAGPGIDEADLPHVFERFRRGSRAQASGRDGMGLGLYLSRHLVEAHGGRIWAERPEGGGARFAFTLPAIDDD